MHMYIYIYYRYQIHGLRRKKPWIIMSGFLFRVARRLGLAGFGDGSKPRLPIAWLGDRLVTWG